MVASINGLLIFLVFMALNLVAAVFFQKSTFSFLPWWVAYSIAAVYIVICTLPALVTSHSHLQFLFVASLTCFFLFFFNRLPVRLITPQAP